MLEMLGETIYSRLSIALLRRWPTFSALQAVSDDELIEFYRTHRCVRKTALEKRIRHLRESVALTTDSAVIEPATLELMYYLAQFEVVNASIEEADQEIMACMIRHEDAELFQGLPGAAEVIAPRLLAAFGSDRSKWQSADDILNFSGIAPVTRSSGKSKSVRRRIACPTFIKQTFHEHAAQSIRHCRWARAFYSRMKAKGKRHHHCVRALAYKWIRIIFICWKKRTKYNDDVYMESLKKRNAALYETALETVLPKERKKA